MTAWSQPRGGRLLSAALARAEAWLLEPAGGGAGPSPPGPPPRPAVVVRGVGTSTIARALAASLAHGDPAGAAVVVGGTPGGARLATPAASRLARGLAHAGCAGVRATGRVCHVPDHNPLALAVEEADAPVVVDVAHGSPPAEGLGHADLVVLVASPAIERSLVEAVELSLALAGHVVEVVVNRVGPDDLPEASKPGRLVIGESRLAAQLALACREARGPFASPIADLAERCRAAAP
jgi:hypothetical protein